MQRGMVGPDRMVLAALLALAIGILTVEHVGAAESASIQAVLNVDGTGAINANSQSNPPGETWSWESCAPDLSSCIPFASGRSISTTGADPDTVFRTMSSNGATALSPIWHGDAASVTPPSITGVIRANELITPVLGTWNGGWDGGAHFTQLAACASAQGTDCITLTDIHYPDGCPGGAAVLDASLTGEYLRVADRLLGPNPVVPGYASNSPYGRDVWVPAPTISTAIVGRIAPATGPRTATCGPPPLPSARLSKRGIATVECLRGCRVALVAKRGLLTARRVRKLPSLSSVTLQLSRAARERLGRGRVLMSVKIDGKRVARRAVLRG